MSFKTSHKGKKEPGRWKPKKKVYGYRYSCKHGHVRVEQDRIEENPPPWCTRCHMEQGEMNRYIFRDKTRIGEKPAN